MSRSLMSETRNRIMSFVNLIMVIYELVRKISKITAKFPSLWPFVCVLRLLIACYPYFGCIARPAWLSYGSLHGALCVLLGATYIRVFTRVLWLLVVCYLYFRYIAWPAFCFTGHHIYLSFECLGCWLCANSTLDALHDPLCVSLGAKYIGWCVYVMVMHVADSWPLTDFSAEVGGFWALVYSNQSFQR